MNEAARTLGRMAAGKPKKMTPAAMRQRRDAARKSARARKGKKIIKNKSCISTETLSYSSHETNHTQQTNDPGLSPEASGTSPG